MPASPTLGGMNKKLRFFARDIGFGDEDTLCVGFCRDQENPKTDDGIVLMRGEGEGDEAGEIFVEIPPERHTTCGGIKKAVFSRNRFQLEFEREAMRDLGGIVAMDIGFDLEEEDFEAVREVVCAIFEDHAGFEYDDGPVDRDGGAPGMPGGRM